MVCTSISITWISKIAFLSALCIYRYAYDVIRKLGACVHFLDKTGYKENTALVTSPSE